MQRLTWRALLTHDPGGDGRYCCPFPPCDQKEVNVDHRSLSVDPKSGAYNCHRCGRTGKLNIQSSQSPIIKKRDNSNDWRDIWNTCVTIVSILDLDYLGNRGIGVVESRDVRYHPSFYYEPSIVFGLRDWMGNLIGCQGRRVDPKEGSSRVCTAAGSQAGIFLSSNRAILSDPLVICESPIDALSLEVLGYPAISVQGTGLPEWINYLTYFRRVIIAPDNDVAGKLAAENWRNKIISASSDIVAPPFGKDWNESLMKDKFGTDEYLGRIVTYIKRGPHPMLDALQSWFLGEGVG